MPQLMPFMWVSSIFMSLMLFTVLMFMYNYVDCLFYLNNEKIGSMAHFMKW